MTRRPTQEVTSINAANDEEEETHLETKERGRKGRKLPKPGSPEFPVTRAWIILMTAFLLHRVGVSAGTIDVQYFHSRYSSMFLNASDSTSVRPAVSKCVVNNSDPLKSVDDAIQKSLSRLQMYITYAGIGPRFVAALFFGSLSDLVGRRFVIIMPVVAIAISQAIMILIIRFDLSLNYCIVNSVIGNAFGTGYVVFIGVFAFTADLTPPEKTRTFVIALIEFSSFLIGIVASLATGYIVQNFGYFYSYFMPFGCSCLSVLLAFFFLPETVPEQVQGIRPSCLNPCRHLKNIFGFYFSLGSRSDRAMISLLMLSLVCLTVVDARHETFLTMYQLDQPFCFDPEHVGYFSAASTGVGATVSLVALRVLQRCLSDSVILVMGIVSFIGQLVLEGFAFTTVMLYLACVAGLLSTSTLSINRALMSGMAGDDKQGALFASIAVVVVVCDLVSNTVYNVVYQATITTTVRGAVFFVMAAIMALGLVCAVVFIKLSQKAKPTYQRIISSDTSTEENDSSTDTGDL